MTIWFFNWLHGIHFLVTFEFNYLTRTGNCLVTWQCPKYLITLVFKSKPWQWSPLYWLNWLNLNITSTGPLNYYKERLLPFPCLLFLFHTNIKKKMNPQCLSQIKPDLEEIWMKTYWGCPRSSQHCKVDQSSKSQDSNHQSFPSTTKSWIHFVMLGAINLHNIFLNIFNIFMIHDV